MVLAREARLWVVERVSSHFSRCFALWNCVLDRETHPCDVYLLEFVPWGGASRGLSTYLVSSSSVGALSGEAAVVAAMGRVGENQVSNRDRGGHGEGAGSRRGMRGRKR